MAMAALQGAPARVAAMVCALVVGVSAAMPARAAVIDITLTETFSFLGPANPGMTWSGSFDIASYAATPNAQFAIGSFSFAMADETLAPFIIDNGNALALHNPTLINDAAGAPATVSGDGSTTLGSPPLSANHAGFAIPVSVLAPVDLGYRLDFNTIFGQTNGWLLSNLVWDGVQLSTNLIRGGTFSLAVRDDSGPTGPVPEPATLLLLGGAFVAVGAFRRRRRAG